jgi:hypothetical protein
MPRGGSKVSEYDQIVFAAWVDEGSPENSNKPIPLPAQAIGDDGAVLIRDTEALDFAAMKRMIFVPYCVDCHAGYTEYAAVVQNIDAIYDRISNGTMPFGGAPLSAELQQALRDWISQGKPESL